MTDLDLPAPLLDPDLGTTDSTPRSIIVAGGCFWCVEGVFERTVAADAGATFRLSAAGRAGAPLTGAR